MEEDWYLVTESVWRKIGIRLLRVCMEEDWYWPSCLLVALYWHMISTTFMRV